MAWTLVNHGSVGFADGGSGHVYTLPSGAPSAGDLDLLTINSDTTVPTPPSGWSVATSFVNSQGSYLYYRFAVGGESGTVTVTTNGNFDTALTWARFTGGAALDVAVNAHVDSVSDVTTPAVSTGTLAATGELVFAFGALHSGGTPSAPSWSSGYTALDAVTQVAVTAYTGYKTGAGTAAETPSVTWTTAVSDRYILVATFTAAGGTNVSVSDGAGTVRALRPADAVSAGVSATDAAGAARAVGSPDAVSTGVTVADGAATVRALRPADAVSTGVTIVDGAAAVRALRPADAVSTGVSAADAAGLVRALRSLDTVTATSATGDVAVTDGAGVLRLLSTEDCWRATSTVARPNTGLVVRPYTGLVARPDSGRVCRP